jgi:TolA-binding protein
MSRRINVGAPRLMIAGGAVALMLATGIGIAVAADRSNPTAASAGTVSCPTVADKLPAIPAQAQAEVTRNLQQLETQIAEANRRLATTVGQGGPNFVQNAILGPLADKRRATIDRIAIAIGRHAARPTGLESLATCGLSGQADVPGQQPPAQQPPVQQPPVQQPPAQQPPAAGARTVSCPAVADKLPAIPAQAQAEVTSNLQQLDKQIAEANQRLATTVGQGGPNFVQNAILGPLADKRRATIDRIAIAIGRHAARPTGLEQLATCTLA